VFIAEIEAPIAATLLQLPQGRGRAENGGSA
jgi:hypothetical protein